MLHPRWFQNVGRKVVRTGAQAGEHTTIRPLRAFKGDAKQCDTETSGAGPGLSFFGKLASATDRIVMRARGKVQQLLRVPAFELPLDQTNPLDARACCGSGFRLLVTNPQE